MSCSNAPQNWESRKNAIHTLYILEGRPLQGKGGVREEMRRRYNFWGGKNQYERYFEEWCFRKKQTKESWQIASLKVGKRKRDGKDSNVYLDGLLLPRKKLHKEMSRQGFMTMKEQLLWAQAPSPSTPAGFQIRTPSANSVSRLVFEELPILQFQGTIQNFAESIPSLDRNSSALVPFINKILNNNATNSTSSMLESFLPTFAFKDETLGSGLAIERIDQMGSTQALSLIVYMISNNLSAESKANEIYRWLKKHGLINPATFRTIKGPSADALLENLFRLAVESEDLQMVKNLISMGANPNASRCKHEGCPIAFTPLQYACLRGNTLLVEELIRAGSHIDDAESEWRDSALILAIFGYGERVGLNGLAGVEGNDMYEDDEEDNEPDLLNLVQILVQSQVSVNFDGHNHHNEAASVDEWILGLRPEETFYPLIAGNHSPLTMASKYLYMFVVDFLLLNEADVSYCLDGLHSALRECLYPSEYMECDESETDQYSWLDCHEIYRRNFAPGVKQSSRIHYIVRSLVEAGVELNDHLLCDDDDDDHSCHWRWTNGNSGCYSALDLAMTTNNAQLANILISAGAHTTKHSLDLAIATKNAELIDIMISTGASTTEHTLDLAMGLAVFDTFRRLLDSVTNPPKWATAPGDNLLISYASPWTKIRHTGILDLHRERALILAAVRLGETSYLKGLVESPKNELTGILDYCLGLPAALEHCCSRGFVETFRFLLRSNFMDRTPLASVLGYSLPIAIENGHDELTDVLLEAGADVNTTLEGKPPIFLAIRRRNLPLVRKLIQAGSRLEYRTPPCHYGGLGNVLISAIDSGYDAVIEEVLRAGADINGLGRAGLGLFSERECFSPLTMAIKRGRWALVDRLRRAQAWVNASCSHLGLGSCRTSLWAATVGKNSQLVRLLLEDGAEVNDLRAVEAAVDDYELLQVFVERLIARAGRGEKFHALRLALGRALGKPRQIESVRLILQSGLVDVNALFEDQTPLAIALRSRHIEEKHEILQLLLNSGANPSSVVCIPSRGDEDRGRQTALMIAIDAKDLGSVNMLLRFGADVNKPAEPGMLYSHAQYAARWGTEDILRALLDRDSDPNSVSPWGQKGNYTRVKIGAAIQEATERNSLEMVQMLLEHKASPDTVTQCSPHTGLQIACRHGNKAIVELLLEYGANVNAPPAERYGATALQFAAIGGYLGIAFLLLAKGANVNAPPAKFEGRSALEGAAEHGRIDMVQLLKNAGADILEVGKEHYERALARALEKGHYATRRLLLSYLS